MQLVQTVHVLAAVRVEREMVEARCVAVVADVGRLGLGDLERDVEARSRVHPATGVVARGLASHEPEVLEDRIVEGVRDLGLRDRQIDVGEIASRHDPIPPRPASGTG